MITEHLTTFRLDVDAEADEKRAVTMLARWHGPDEFHETDDKGRNAHAGLRALNTFNPSVGNAEITSRQVPALVDYVNRLEAWAHEEIDAFSRFLVPVDDAATVRLQASLMAGPIVEARRECLEDIAEFRRVIIEPMLAEMAVSA